ncbi:hypothetical protein [Minwuia sp.]|uniref:hypothetical protein n=1 Tax=Minwuia sp. TaxID=2493630 RepID=UPI003A938611
MSAASALIEGHLNGALDRASAPDEAHWHAFWHAQGFGSLSPVAMAIRGGLAARSLSQVFVAGYQGALHTVFRHLPADGWAAYAAAEDRSDPQNHPGTVLTPDGTGYRLDGFKSWVGQSRHVRHLLVTAKLDGADRIARLDASAAGISLSHRDAPAFLKELSQGFAAFDGARPDGLVDGVDMRAFGRTEPPFVMLACAAFLLAEAPDGAVRDRLIALVAALADYIGDLAYAPRTLAALDRALQALAADLDGADIPDWPADRRLIGMYSPRIQKRA